MRALVIACEDCGLDKPTLISCVEINTGNQHLCHQCKKCILDMPKLKIENRIIPMGICPEHKIKKNLASIILSIKFLSGVGI
jgi:hypothetical protein